MSEISRRPRKKDAADFIIDELTQKAKRCPRRKVTPVSGMQRRPPTLNKRSYNVERSAEEAMADRFKEAVEIWDQVNRSINHGNEAIELNRSDGSK